MVMTRPVRPAADSKLLGKNVLVFMNYGEGATAEAPVWGLLGGQRSASFTASADEVDLTDKTSGGYGEAEQGIKSTEMELELIVKPGDEVVQQLYDAFDKGEAVDLLRWAKDGRSIRNWYSITELGEEAAYDDAAILTATLKGMGAPTYTESMEDPRETV